MNSRVRDFGFLTYAEVCLSLEEDRQTFHAGSNIISFPFFNIFGGKTSAGLCGDCVVSPAQMLAVTGVSPSVDVFTNFSTAAFILQFRLRPQPQHDGKPL